MLQTLATKVFSNIYMHKKIPYMNKRNEIIMATLPGLENTEIILWIKGKLNHYLLAV